MTHPELPEIIAEIADVAGVDAAWALAREKGGLTVFIPAQPRRDHWLVKLVGLEAAEKICAHFRVISGDERLNGARLLIPMAAAAQSAERWRQVLAAEMSASQVARTMGVHERTVWRHRARQRDDDDSQGSLF
jgi:hypothetical protein